MRTALLFAATAALAMIGCKDEPLPQHTSAPVPPAADAAPAAPVQRTEAAVVPPQPSAPTPAVSGAVATADGEKPGVSLTVTEFKRGSGGTATLKFTIANNGSDSFSFGYALGDPALGGADHGSVGGVHLIDPVNKKKYFVVRDADNRCVCSRELKSIAPGERMNLWAKFPAPADVQRVSIVVPHFMPMDDVPIS